MPDESYQDYSRRVSEEALREAQQDEEASVGCLGYALLAVAVVAAFAGVAVLAGRWLG